MHSVQRIATGLPTLLLLVGVCSLPAIAQSTYIYVDAKAPGVPPGNHTGQDWPRAFNTIQEAIDEAAMTAGKVDIIVAEGVYTPTTAQWNGFQGEDYTILLKTSSDYDDVRLHGGFKGCDDGTCNGYGSDHPDSPDGVFVRTILTGNQYYRHVLVADGDLPQVSTAELRLDGFLVTEGNAAVGGGPQGKGAGLYSRYSANVMIENVTFKDNVANLEGGGAYNSNATDNNGRFRCKKSVFKENSANRGGGLFVEESELEVQLYNIRFRDNTGTGTDSYGGGIYLGPDVELQAANLVMHDNSADIGGAVCVEPGIYYPPDGQPSVSFNQKWDNCTIAFNGLPGQGTGGIAILQGYNYPRSVRTVTITNSILWGNEYNDLSLWTGPNGTAVTGRYTDVGVINLGGWVHWNWTQGPGFLRNADPLFVAPASRNLRLKASVLGPFSPCIDTGSALLLPGDPLNIDNDLATSTLPLDYDLNPRWVQCVPTNPNEVDMGAYEKGALGVPPGQ